MQERSIEALQANRDGNGSEAWRDKEGVCVNLYRLA
jgi:hypothetical protein